MNPGLCIHNLDPMWLLSYPNSTSFMMLRARSLQSQLHHVLVGIEDICRCFYMPLGALTLTAMGQ